MKMLSQARKPFFITAHFADPHAPYQDHDRFTADPESLTGQYAGEVRYTDYWIGRLLDHLQSTAALRDNTIVVLFSDHGENLGEHGVTGGHHGVSLYD
jgi:arylsulfatase A-like enzyme